MIASGDIGCNITLKTSSFSFSKIRQVHWSIKLDLQENLWVERKI